MSGPRCSGRRPLAARARRALPAATCHLPLLARACCQAAVREAPALSTPAPLPPRRRSFVRVGCAIMLLHDANDVLLEASKLANYWQYKRVANGLFATFVGVWMVLRLG